ncbi:MAG TPA: class I SAM-dependent methyltransferase [Terracidiphilus sp.]|nr:class I SAM-dependent methyltransferase [Terracidiphilus sp.]
MTAVPQRDPFQGVRQILRFNWPKYAAAAAITGAVTFVAPLLPMSAGFVLLAASLPVVFWTASSLLISHYVYDRSHLYDFSWLPLVLKISPKHWLNVHCGLDETSALLAARFPDAAGEIVDIFDPCAMTENSIRQARAAQHNATRSTPARFHALPFPAGAFDAVFCIFTAHELRRHADRVRLFAEIARLLAPGGTFVLVEHLRDWPNFPAFGPGFLHFHTWRAWQQAAHEADLVGRTDFPFTPFVRIAAFRRRI